MDILMWACFAYCMLFGANLLSEIAIFWIVYSLGDRIQERVSVTQIELATRNGWMTHNEAREAAVAHIKHERWLYTPEGQAATYRDFSS